MKDYVGAFLMNSLAGSLGIDLGYLNSAFLWEQKILLTPNIDAGNLPIIFYQLAALRY